MSSWNVVARADIDELFSSDRDLSSTLEEVARLSVRMMAQVAVEAEVDELLGSCPLRAAVTMTTGRATGTTGNRRRR